MAKVFGLPEGFEAPQLDFNNLDIPKFNKECDDFKQRLKDWCINRNPTQKNVGEIIRWQVADGYAEYMVAAMKPVQIIHLPLLDEYQCYDANFVTAKQIQFKINQERALADLFSKNKK